MSLSDADATGDSQDSSGSATGNVAETRQENGIYQNGRCVAEASDARIDSQAREIHFGEIYGSDDLLIPEDCEFRDYRVLIQRIGFASRQEAGAAHKGRVLKGVVAEILGYREH